LVVEIGRPIEDIDVVHDPFVFLDVIRDIVPAYVRVRYRRRDLRFPERSNIELIRHQAAPPSPCYYTSSYLFKKSFKRVTLTAISRPTTLERVNVVRHAGARTCRVLLGLDDKGGAYVAIGDDGRGPLVGDAGVESFAAGASSLHHGTTIMRERAQSLGGSLRIGPRAAGGTRVLLRFRPRALREGTVPAHEPIARGVSRPAQSAGERSAAADTGAPA
jgi:hypothetical protein